MSLNDIFRSFFGIPSRNDGDFRDQDRRLDLFTEDEDGDETGSFGFHGFSAMDDVFKHFHGDMQRQMEEIQSQMEDMFKTFGTTDFPAITPGFEGDQRGMSGVEGGSLHHKMLKPETESDRGCKIVPFRETPDSTPPFQMPSFFDRIFTVPNWKPVKPHDRIDQDLDEEVKSGHLAKIFDQPVEEFTEIQPRFHKRQPHSSFRNVTIQRIRKSDGTYEEKKTTRDSSGNEETTVTRSVGDQSHSVTTRKHKDREEEVMENFRNIDQDKMPYFEKLWRGGRGESPSSNPRDELIVPRNDSDTTSLFRKFFGPSLTDTPPAKPR